MRSHKEKVSGEGLQMEGMIGWVVVLGDLGRSPRMQYHTTSLLKRGAKMHVVAYQGSSLIPYLAHHQSLTVHAIQEPPSWLSKLPRIFTLAVKAALQLLMMLHLMLVVMPTPDFALVQLPPSIPTLVVCWMVKTLRGVRFVYDWHNFGFTIMEMTMGKTLLVAFAKLLERMFGRCGNYHMCVTEAMQSELAINWGIKANVVYDRPPDMFRTSTSEEVDLLMRKLTPVLSESLHDGDFCADMVSKIEKRQPLANQGESLVTVCEWGGTIKLRSERPGIVVSSTSWTVDEDFSLLLDAACMYDEKVMGLQGTGSSATHPKLLFIITGKGPLKEYYLNKMQKKTFTHVAFRTVWLEPEDYPLLLGSANLGVSLHASSSGLDLPMKIVDMYGCGLPVCALGYSCLSELVDDGSTGLIFKTSQELANQLLQLFAGFPKALEEKDNELDQLRKRVVAMKGFSWEENWERYALPVFKKAQSSR